jgi:hypothetical protein
MEFYLQVEEAITVHEGMRQSERAAAEQQRVRQQQAQSRASQQPQGR